MKIYAVTFGDDFKRLTNAFTNSVKKNTPYELEIIEIAYEKVKGDKKQSHYNNLRKLKIWRDLAINATEPILLMDTDLILLDSFPELENIEHDIAITTRPSTVKYNAGVIYLKNTDKAKEFMKVWYRKSNQLFETDSSEIVKIFKGLTQSALAVIHQFFTDYILELPCDIYNLAATDWKHYSDKTKIIHIKDDLRKACLNDTPFVYPQLVAKWKEYDY